MFSPRRSSPSLLLAALAALGASLLACGRSVPATPVHDPASVWSATLPPTPEEVIATATTSFSLPPTRVPGAPFLTPTADPIRIRPTQARGAETYIIQPGDTLGGIARLYNISVEAIMQANGLTNPNVLSVGASLTIPAVTPQAVGPGFKVIPDSELVYGPLSQWASVDLFVQSKGGYLAGYSQDVDGETMTGAQIVQHVAESYSVNPRLLLAILDYRAGWVTRRDADPARLETPLGWIDDYYVGLYRQLVWAANGLNQGYYRWRYLGVSDWVLADGSVVPVDATINAGTAGVQNLFALLDDYPAWLRDVSPGGIYDTFFVLFGYPFDLAVEPLVPAYLLQPRLHLPFEPGVVWSFTGGPHAAWDSGSPWGALDFAPTEVRGCVQSDAWVTAAADGLVIRTGDGAVILDLDGDSNEGTGWVVVYMHIESRDRVRAGTSLHAGDRIGHPSCEGGIADATHVHLARRFNGEWIPAAVPVPFNLEGWIAGSLGEEYEGTLTRNGILLESYNGSVASNQIQH